MQQTDAQVAKDQPVGHMSRRLFSLYVVR